MDIFILIISPFSIKSEYVKWELNFAIQLNKPIIPVIYEECSLPDEISHIQCLDAGRDYVEALAEIVNVCLKF